MIYYQLMFDLHIYLYSDVSGVKDKNSWAKKDLEGKQFKNRCSRPSASECTAESQCLPGLI